MPKPCVFCDSEATEKSREDVVPRWIGKLLTVHGPNELGVWRGEGEPITRSLKVVEQTVSGVCRRCNNGWMSGLERSVQQKLEPMILQRKITRLTPYIQMLFATWATKTAFMFDLVGEPPHVIPDFEYRGLYNKKKPSGNFIVSLGVRAGPNGIEPWNSVNLTRSRVKIGSIRSYIFQIGIGYVLFEVVWYDAPANSLAIGNDDIRQPIWPRRGGVGAHTWPKTKEYQQGVQAPQLEPFIRSTIEKWRGN